MNEASALYRGAVLHRRIRPKAHRLRYRVFWTLLDLDEVGALGKRLRFFSLDRFNLISFHAADHGDSRQSGLRAFVEEKLRGAGIKAAGGRIRILTMPRVLGYVFNPISVYFCDDADGHAAAVLYEVNNTFGQRHFYVAAVDPDAAPGAMLRHGCAKDFYVSPFLGMDLAYRFQIAPPGERVVLSVNVSDEAGPLIATSMVGERAPLDDPTVLRTALAFPFLTLKVIVGIHWEALKLWLKGVPLTKRPRAADRRSTRIA
jgi:hypothetical protein